MTEKLPERLSEIVEDFSFCVGKEKLEYLLQFAENMPPLPEWAAQKAGEADQVHECMTPVLIYVQQDNGQLTYYFDVPEESPTVRGYAAIMHEGTQGLPAEDILQIPNNFYQAMGLQDVITGQRLNGLSAILAHMKKLATNHL